MEVTRTPHLALTTGNPVVGQWYMVPCVRGEWFNRVADWPVIGTLHQDLEFFGFAVAHYHVDARFLRKGLWPSSQFTVDNDFVRVIASPLQTSARINEAGLPRPVLRRRRCVFASFDMAGFRYHAKAPIEQMARAFPQAIAGKHGWICPHQQFDMRNVSPDEDGNITCPMHGLKFCAASGRCVDLPAGERFKSHVERSEAQDLEPEKWK